ncbi:DUF2232 domain-containing protein [Bradyrhizobium sp. DASA03005]|uniref:DUF2232 domain-containing protein n=1 Tax=Bradyrhizobium TaxID=374 RepID=UPI00155EC93E|nr:MULTISPECIES: DUF2232 domain-containing protein [Bradyrhizobium]MDD1521180.1 hypothetical protein [Bradyrhizobium sp. WBAH30]MDD1544748.1 hypothetical protein [Bradyrhizobium sp. WBAH41]MDD1556760.1 hypothetical protein [Bradyrhizobium sp. WBAH23]MDD1564562.1 hypothetical protein [Bradyrhizobium sp. WBAH33]MDD1589886.1 hypothetical protein [Bradyrhizobium sp. WBAH42]
MMAFGLIALIAGAASALMFASIISGALISLVLFYLAPLPLMVAAIGWGPLCASLGGIAAAIGLGALFGLPYCIAFAVTVALPAWWLGHLVLLGRQVGSTAPATGTAPAAEPDIEWYPVGRILLWIAGFATLTTMAALLTLGTDAETITGTLRRGLMRLLRATDPQTSGEASQFVDALVRIAPAAATIAATMTLTLNLWLSAKVTATSGRLRRPWPDLKATELPQMTLVVLCISLAFCFTGGLLAIVAQIATAALMMSYALAGFAVLHTLTLALNGRTFWLGSTYAAVVVFGWPVIAMVILGLADAVFGFRERFLRSRQPPPLPTP